MNSTIVLYVHGFKSSSRANKSELTKQYIRDYEVDLAFDAMDLPNTVKAAFEEMSDMIEKYKNSGMKVTLIGTWAVFCQCTSLQNMILKRPL